MVENKFWLETLIAALVGISLNYLNQAFSWSFDSMHQATICFIIFSIFFLSLSFYYSHRLYNFFKRVKINPDIGNKKKGLNIAFNTFKIFLPVSVLLLLILIYASSFITFQNYRFFKNQITDNQNNRSTMFTLSSSQGKDDEEYKWIIINNIFSDFNDDETNAFANNFQNSLQSIIRKHKLPIKIYENIEKSKIDSLITGNDIVLEIYGTFFQGAAEIYVETITKTNKYTALNALTTSLKLDFLKNSVDSLINLESSRTTINKQDIIKYDNSDNPTLTKYNIRIGIPNEIKYLLYSAMSDFVANVTNGIISLDTSNILEVKNTLDFALKMADLAESNISYEVNYLGVKPKVRKGINLPALLTTKLNLYLLKVSLILGKPDSKKLVTYSNLQDAKNILNQAEIYYKQIPDRKNKLENADSLEVAQIFTNKLMKSYYLGALQSLNLCKFAAELNEVTLSIQQHLPSQPMFNKNYPNQFSGSAKPKLSKKTLDKWINTYDRLISLAIENDGVQKELIKKIDENITFMQSSDLYKNQYLMILSAINIKNQLVKNQKSSDEIGKVMVEQKNAMMLFRKTLK